MSIKRFCDVCGKEGSETASDRIQGQVGKVMFEVLVGISPTWNSGDVCHDCVRKAIAESGKEARP